MADQLIGKFIVSRGPVVRTHPPLFGDGRTELGWVAYLDVYNESDTSKTTKKYTMSIAFDGTAESFAKETQRKMEKLVDTGKAVVEEAVDKGLAELAKAPKIEEIKI